MTLRRQREEVAAARIRRLRASIWGWALLQLPALREVLLPRLHVVEGGATALAEAVGQGRP